MVALRLSRQQIAQIVGNDPEAIKQFEKLFTLNQDYLVSGMADSSAIDSGSALAMANQALGTAGAFEERISALEQAPRYEPDVGTGGVIGVGISRAKGRFVYV